MKRLLHCFMLLMLRNNGENNKREATRAVGGEFVSLNESIRRPSDNSTRLQPLH